MVAQREKFSSQASPELLAEMREIASNQGRYFQTVLEDAMRLYIETSKQERSRPEVMAHYRDSVAKHRRLYELLAL